MPSDSIPDDSIPNDSIADDSIPGGSMPDEAIPNNAPPAAPKPPSAGRHSFPVGKLVMSAVGIAVAAWVWLGFGWRWDVTPGDLAEGRPPMGLHAWPGRYVRLVDARDSGLPPVELPGGKGAFHAYVDTEDHTVLVKFATSGAPRAGPPTGRVMSLFMNEADERTVVDATRGRLDARAVMAVVIILWGLAHAGANVWFWRRRREATSGRGAA